MSEVLKQLLSLSMQVTAVKRVMIMPSFVGRAPPVILMEVVELVVKEDRRFHEPWHYHDRRSLACQRLLLGQRVGVCLQIRA